MAHRTDHEQLDTVNNTGSGQSQSYGHQDRQNQKEKAKPTPSQPGYEWSRIRDNWYTGGQRQEVQLELLHQNKKHRHRLQKKGKVLCPEPEEDWMDECLPLSSTPVERDMVIQTVDVEDTGLPIQREVSTDASYTDAHGGQKLSG